MFTLAIDYPVRALLGHLAEQNKRSSGVLKTVVIRGHHICNDLISKESVVLDLGGNDGRFAVEIHQLFGCRVESVEAHPGMAGQLGNSDWWRAFNYAVTDFDGELLLNLSENSEANSILEIGNSVASTTVPAIRLDTFLQKHSSTADILKVDIEGAEIAFIDSISPELLGRFKQITIEFHDFVPEWNLGESVFQSVEKIKEAGFYCVKFSRNSHIDVLFIRRDQINRIQYLFLRYISRNVEGIVRMLRRTLGETR